MIGQNFAGLKLQRNRRARPLSAMRSTIKVRATCSQWTADAHKILAVLQTSNDLRQYVQLNLSILPLLSLMQCPCVKQQRQL